MLKLSKNIALMGRRIYGLVKVHMPTFKSPMNTMNGFSGATILRFENRLNLMRGSFF